MLQFLTDEQITPDVVVAAKVRCRELSAVSLLHWMDGHFVSASDEEVLREAALRHRIDALPKTQYPLTSHCFGHRASSQPDTGADG